MGRIRIRIRIFKINKDNYLLSLDVFNDEVEIIQEKIKKAEHQINTIKHQLKIIDERIRELDNESIHDECPICMNSLINNEPCMFLCCKNFVCYKCVSKCIKMNYTTCSLCRQHLKHEHIIKFMSKTESVRTKTEAIDLVLNDCFQRSGINTRVFHKFFLPRMVSTTCLRKSLERDSSRKPWSLIKSKRSLDLGGRSKIKTNVSGIS